MANADTRGNEQVRVYALANPASVKQEEADIERIFCETLHVADRARYVLQVSESSGWIEFMDKEQLWCRRTPPSLPDGNGARKKAEDFLVALARAFNSSAPRLPDRLRTMMLQPPLRPAQLVKAPNPTGLFFDHWLYRGHPLLAFGRTVRRSVPVFGSQVEVRIGDIGQVIGYCSRWRPVVNDGIYRDLVPIPPAPGSDKGNRQQEQYSPVYLLEGDGIPQYYLAPYYLVNDGNDLTLQSACDYSLTVTIGQRESGQGTSLTALADGGSGNYAFNWAVYSLDTVLDEGFRELGQGRLQTFKTADGSVVASTLDVPSGAYIAMINVKDRTTGAFKHHQQQVYSSGFIQGREPPLNV
jgi:hypothetical protein